MHKDDIASLHSILPTFTPVVFLDTARRSAQRECSYLFLHPRSVLTANRIEEIPDLLKQMDSYSRTHWVVGYISYEAAYAIEPRLALSDGSEKIPGLAWFGVFDRPYVFSHRDARWSPSLPETGKTVTGIPVDPEVTRSRIDPETYSAAVAGIREYIARGDTYQINFTADIEVRTALDEFGFYRCLRNKQPTPYSAFIRNEYGSILSFSPELFFERKGSSIRVKPMKGTAPRGKYPEEDAALARWPARDAKNLAENVMIVDLMRNDLGRICRTGSVRTTKLFDIETHPTVHQMTSTVQGRLRRGIEFSDIVRAIFPCGSVTGAPKIRSMEIIREMETGMRGVYCGMIGYTAPDSTSVFSVPIRTLQKGAGESHWRYRVGSGIVWDSNPREEWLECETKCRFLTENEPDYRLLESLLLNEGSYLYKREHIRRMKRSASFLGFCLNEPQIESSLKNLRRKYPTGKWKVRLLLSREGQSSLDCAPLESGGNPCPRNIRIAQTPIDESQKLLYHKTDYRPWYRDAMESIRRGKCYDVIFTNSSGLVTEGARSNVFAQIAGILYTPPVQSGLLPGVLRKNLLRRGACTERELTVEQLLNAEAVFCGNSVRGLVRVVFVDLRE